MISFFRIGAMFLCAVSAVALGDTKTVRDYGAVGDGMADDTAAIQKAMEGGSVIFPKGTYRLTKTVVIDLDHDGFTSLEGDGTARIVMAGAGPAFHFIGTHANSADPWNVRSEVWERQRMPVVRGLEIVGENPEADGIEATGTMQLTISSVMVREARHGIHLTKRDRNIIIADCHLYNNHGCGVYFDHVNLHQSNIVGCHISYNAGGGVVTRGGEVRNLQIAGCDLESNMTATAPPTANVLIDSTDGSTAEVAVTGCTLQHNSKSPGSANLRFIGRGVVSADDPSPTDEGHLVVTGNVFSDVQVNIHLQHAQGVSIVGNTFWEGFEQNLLIEDSQCVVVGANDFNRNPRYVVNHTMSRERNGIVLRRCADSKIEGLLLKEVRQEPAAVLIEGCTRCTLQDCSILDCDGLGLLLKDSTKCRVSGCVIRDDRGEKREQLSLKEEGGGGNWISD
jgi:parallel beta-helix repeat protein